MKTSQRMMLFRSDKQLDPKQLTSNRNEMVVHLGNKGLVIDVETLLCEAGALNVYVPSSKIEGQSRFYLGLVSVKL